ncbi:hypothetical protein ACP70R_034137 [Stipagrostis hirtigluma subsp. patula]
MAAPRGLSAAATATDVSRCVRAGRRPCSELERIVGERYRSGSLGPEDALHLFDELLPPARPDSVGAFNKLHRHRRSTRPRTLLHARRPSTRCLPLQPHGPSRRQEGGSRHMHLQHHDRLLACCCRAGQLQLGFAVFGHVIKTGWRVDAITFTHLIGAFFSRGSVLRRGV